MPLLIQHFNRALRTHTPNEMDAPRHNRRLVGDGLPERFSQSIAWPPTLTIARCLPIQFGRLVLVHIPPLKLRREILCRFHRIEMNLLPHRLIPYPMQPFHIAVAFRFAHRNEDGFDANVQTQTYDLSKMMWHSATAIKRGIVVHLQTLRNPPCFPDFFEVGGHALLRLVRKNRLDASARFQIDDMKDIHFRAPVQKSLCTIHCLDRVRRGWARLGIERFCLRGSAAFEYTRYAQHSLDSRDRWHQSQTIGPPQFAPCRAHAPQSPTTFLHSPIGAYDQTTHRWQICV